MTSRPRPAGGADAAGTGSQNGATPACAGRKQEDTAIKVSAEAAGTAHKQRASPRKTPHRPEGKGANRLQRQSRRSGSRQSRRGPGAVTGEDGRTGRELSRMTGAESAGRSERRMPGTGCGGGRLQYPPSSRRSAGTACYAYRNCQGRITQPQYWHRSRGRPRVGLCGLTGPLWHEAPGGALPGGVNR